jgi:hypothetical protein
VLLIGFIDRTIDRCAMARRTRMGSHRYMTRAPWEPLIRSSPSCAKARTCTPPTSTFPPSPHVIATPRLLGPHAHSAVVRVTFRFGETPLHYAVKSGNLTTIGYLLYSVRAACLLASAELRLVTIASPLDLNQGSRALRRVRERKRVRPGPALSPEIDWPAHLPQRYLSKPPFSL